MAINYNVGDLTYPEHMDIGIGKYAEAAMNRAPDFSGVNQMFSAYGGMGPLVRGGQFINPQQAQQLATPGYLGARGQIAQNNISNMFNLANSALAAGQGRNLTANDIVNLMAQQTQSQTGSLFGGLF